MALARLLFRIDGDSSGFRAATEDAIGQTRRAEQGIRSMEAAMIGFSAAAATALGIVSEIRSESEQLDREALSTTADAGLVGGDRATALAFQSTQELFGVGPEQAFDAAEALGDALRNRPQEAIPVARGIGLDSRAFLAEEDPTQRVYQVIDALVARGGAVDDDVLAAASELGAGDIRDLATLAGPIAADPSVHPRAIAQSLQGLTLDDSQVTDITGRSVNRDVDRRIAREHLAGEPWWNLDRLIGGIPIIGDIHEEQLGQELRRQGGPTGVNFGNPFAGFTGGAGAVVRIEIDEAAANAGVRARVSDQSLNDEIETSENQRYRPRSRPN